MGTENPHLDVLRRIVTFEWQPVEDVYAQATPAVPPGKALRHYQRQAVGVLPSEDVQIQSGARDIVRRTVGSMRGVEVASVNGTKSVRRLDRRAPERSAVVRQLEHAGIDLDRVTAVLDGGENWGRLVHAYEVLTVLGVVRDALQADASRDRVGLARGETAPAEETEDQPCET